MSALRDFWNNIVGNPSPAPDSTGNPPADTSGTVTIPEVTVVGDPKSGQAYQIGFADGRAGSPSHRGDIEQIAPGPTEILASYDEGYRDGQKAGPPPSTDQPQYDGPSIGPDNRTDEQREEDRKAQEEREKEQRELLKWATGQDKEDPHTHAEGEVDPPPPPNPPALVE